MLKTWKTICYYDHNSGYHAVGVSIITSDLDKFWSEIAKPLVYLWLGVSSEFTEILIHKML
ncbi:hypothetical protein [Merismopedia glauca]|uniref:hypothetical protein n=1 Tax=Merismopedia glauca TaxID=292586 RepID=UPI0011B299C1|nr:hypothetical protein [Merismopedia glauca]